MCFEKPKLPEPLAIVEYWLEEYVSPQVSGIEISSKKSNSFDSNGVSVGLVPDIQKKFKPTGEINLTVESLAPELIAGLVEKKSPFVTSFEDLPNPLTQLDLEVLHKNLPPIGAFACKQFSYHAYTSQQFLCKYAVFSIAFDPKIFGKLDIVAKYLYYRAKFLEYSFGAYPSIKEKEKKEFQTHISKYQQFLLNILIENLTALVTFGKVEL